MRILGMLKASKQSEAGAPPSKELIEKMGKFVEEITKAGVFRTFLEATERVKLRVRSCRTACVASTGAFPGQSNARTTVLGCSGRRSSDSRLCGQAVTAKVRGPQLRRKKCADHTLVGNVSLMSAR
jgi:hypothetical protein